ncbi:PilN domain-containing protein [Ralstonia sp. Ralssp110]|uniref:PilN domain-containing protein n=1 Tax=Ralstonia sp. Ralssp110 TaxID=3243004 RepID=UPI0039B591F8
MKRLHIDFAASTRSRFAPTSTALMLIIAGMLGCGLALPHVVHLVQQYQSLGERLIRVSERTQVLAHQQEQSIKSLTPEQVSTVNRAVRRLNVPWRDLFDMLELATPQTVALLSLEPDADRSVLKLSAEAATVDDMIEYVQRLKSRPEVQSVSLNKHQVDAKDPYHPVRFTLTLNWRYPERLQAPAASESHKGAA